MDKKKSSDLQLVNKNWPRHGKKREKQNQTLQNENNIQRNKNRQNHDKKPFNFNDKRPKPRNSSSNGAFNNNHFPTHSFATSSGLALENSFDELDNANDYENEIALNSIYLPGSKKQNLNHLLNFHYAPREDHNLFGRASNQRYNCYKKHKYNKEQYLQANFQFVIKSSARKLIDPNCPDILIDWDNIEQIRMQTTEEPQCPICLYKPVAAKLTRCGHVYCWTCILHYLSLSDKAWRKCPICFDAVHIKDLKSALVIQQIELNVNNYVTFQLMRRKKNSIFCEKVVSSEEQNSEKYFEHIPHLADSDEKKLFSKFVLANYHEILSVLEKERGELNENFDENCPESIIFQQALNLLSERKLDLDKENQNVVEALIQNITIDDGVAQDSPDSGVKIINQSLTGAIAKESKYYYFYQSIDGQNIFLHPLNVRMIQAMYGSLENGPLNIEAKIIQKEIQSMDEELRKKFTCLGHLPLTCQFSIVEVELDPPIVSDDILNIFRDDIVLRQKTRQRKAREENKREREINYLNERQIGKYVARSANINIESAAEFPTCGFEEPLTRSSFNESNASDDKELHDLASQSPKTCSTSFAKILSSPKKESWPSLSSTYSSTAAWPVSWNSRHSTNDQPSKLNNNQIQKHDEDNHVIHTTSNSLADAVAEALQKGGKSEKNGSKKKSRKNKKISLSYQEFPF